MINQQIISCICELFESACIELFQNIHCDIIKLDNIKFDTLDVPHAYLDAGCDDFELDVHLFVPFSTLAMTYPSLGHIATISEAALEDWLCEMSNLLMGKLKKRLYEHGAIVKLGLPNYSMNGRAIQSSMTGNGQYFALTYEIDQQLFEAGIVIEVFNESLQLVAQEPIASMASGEIDFF